MKRTISLHAFMTDKALAGRYFAKDSFKPWRTMAKILDGAPLNADELALFRQCTGRNAPPTEPITEFYGVKSRREGYTAFFGGNTFAGTDVPNASSGALPPGQSASYASGSNYLKDRDFLAISVSYSF